MIYEFAATQDLHGYSKPWAPGTGKNLFETNPDNVIYENGGSYFNLVCSNGTIEMVVLTSQILALFPVFKVFEISEEDVGKAFVFSSQTNSSAIRIMICDLDGSNRVEKSSNPYIITEDDIGKAFCLRFYNDSGANRTWTDIQVEQNSTATAYEPYGNVCMPEGFNIWDPTNQEYIQVYAGYVNANTRELYLRPVYEEYAGEELVGPWMSSLDPYEEDATPTEGAFVIDFGGEMTSYEITPFMLQTLLDSLGIRQHFTDGAGLLNKLMDQAQGRVRSEDELLHLSRPLKVIAIGDQLPAGLTFKPISKDVLPGLPGKFIR